MKRLLIAASAALLIAGPAWARSNSWGNCYQSDGSGVVLGRYGETPDDTEGV